MGTVLFVNKRTKQMVPLSQFLDIEQLLADVAGRDGRRAAPRGDDGAGRRSPSSRTSRRAGAPGATGSASSLKQFLQPDGRRAASKIGEFESDADEFEWRALFVAGMWFQDLFNYDFRRTEMCIIPYGTQMGEISFCAYNTGVGWRNVIEKMKANATVAEWYQRTGATRSTPRTRSSRSRRRSGQS